MSGACPPDLPARMDHQAELTDLRHVALCLLQEPGRGAYPRSCRCSACKAARRWVPTIDPMNHHNLANQVGRR